MSGEPVEFQVTIKTPEQVKRPGTETADCVTRALELKGCITSPATHRNKGLRLVAGRAEKDSGEFDLDSTEGYGKITLASNGLQVLGDQAKQEGWIDLILLGRWRTGSSVEVDDIGWLFSTISLP